MKENEFDPLQLNTEDDVLRSKALHGVLMHFQREWHAHPPDPNASGSDIAEFGASQEGFEALRKLSEQAATHLRTAFADGESAAFADQMFGDLRQEEREGALKVLIRVLFATKNYNFDLTRAVQLLVDHQAQLDEADLFGDDVVLE